MGAQAAPDRAPSLPEGARPADPAGHRPSRDGQPAAGELEQDESRRRPAASLPGGHRRQRQPTRRGQDHGPQRRRRPAAIASRARSAPPHSSSTGQRRRPERDPQHDRAGRQERDLRRIADGDGVQHVGDRADQRDREEDHEPGEMPREPDDERQDVGSLGVTAQPPRRCGGRPPRCRTGVVGSSRAPTGRAVVTEGSVEEVARHPRGLERPEAVDDPDPKPRRRNGPFRRLHESRIRAGRRGSSRRRHDRSRGPRAADRPGAGADPRPAISSSGAPRNADQQRDDDVGRGVGRIEALGATRRHEHDACAEFAELVGAESTLRRRRGSRPDRRPDPAPRGRGGSCPRHRGRGRAARRARRRGRGGGLPQERGVYGRPSEPAATVADRGATASAGDDPPDAPGPWRDDEPCATPADHRGLDGRGAIERHRPQLRGIDIRQRHLERHGLVPAFTATTSRSPSSRRSIASAGPVVADRGGGPVPEGRLRSVADRSTERTKARRLRVPPPLVPREGARDSAGSLPPLRPTSSP